MIKTIDRQYIFSHEEVKEALIAFLTAKNQPAPVLGVTDIEFSVIAPMVLQWKETGEV